jgi:hypothetical protein
VVSSPLPAGAASVGAKVTSAVRSARAAAHPLALIVAVTALSGAYVVGKG